MNASSTITISDIITTSHLADFLTAEWGQRLVVWPNGTVSLVDASTAWRTNDDAPIAEVRCPGIGNLNTDYFTEGFAQKELSDEGDWTGQYTETGTDRVIGTIEDVIFECCRYGDVTAEMDELIERLTESQAK